MNAAIGAFALFGLLFVIIGLGVFYSSRVKKVGPNQALVISGRPHRGVDEVTGEAYTTQYRIVTGGRAFIMPVIERVDDLSLELMTIEVTTPDVYTLEGVPVTVDGVAQVKIGSDRTSVRTAAERFLSKSGAEVQHVAHETLAGHLRAILGTLTVEQIYKDRDAFAQQVQGVSADDLRAQQVQGVSADDLRNMGLSIDSFVIKDIQDDQGYLDALGQARTAEVKRDATIGQANAARDATIKSAQARQAGETAKFQAETKIASSSKDYQVQKAEYDQEVNRQRVKADLETDLQQRISQQQIKAEEVQVQVVDKQKQILVQEQEATRMENELLATVRRPAEAEQFRIETLARAKKFQTETEATGQAEAIRATGTAEADATKAKGLAQAEVIRRQGLAEAEAMQKKAEAWQQYNQAAIIQQLIDALPEVARAISEPLAKTDRIVVISNGGDGGAGASRVTADVANIVAQVPTTIEALTGLDLVQTIRNLPGISQAKPSDESQE
jgi:flotillin